MVSVNEDTEGVTDLEYAKYIFIVNLFFPLFVYKYTRKTSTSLKQRGRCPLDGAGSLACRTFLPKTMRIKTLFNNCILRHRIWTYQLKKVCVFVKIKYNRPPRNYIRTHKCTKTRPHVMFSRWYTSLKSNSGHVHDTALWHPDGPTAQSK